MRLSNNKIFKVTNSTFDGLKTVTILSLRKNFIEELSAKVFSSLTSIEELDLGQNRIRSINAETFLGRDGKITIRFCHSDDYFKNNQQTDKVKENFVFDRKDENHENLFPSSNVGLDHLRVLYLNDNDLQQVPTESLVPLPHLAELNLGLNNIKEIFTFT